MESYLERLKQLTNELPDFSEFINKKTFNTIEFNMIKGIGTLQGIFKTDKIAIALGKCSLNSEFPEHSHCEDEWLIILSGECTILVDGMQKILRNGDYIYIPANTKHSGTCGNKDKEVEYVCITVPPSSDYPEAETNDRKQ